MVYLESIILPEGKLLPGAPIIFILSDKSSLNGELRKSKEDVRSTYWVELQGQSNSELFNRLALDKNSFVKRVVGYKLKYGILPSGWPEVNSLEDLNKVLEALKYVNKPVNVPSKEDRLSIKVKTNKHVKFNFKL